MKYILRNNSFVGRYCSSSFEFFLESPFSGSFGGQRSLQVLEIEKILAVSLLL